MTKEQMQAVLPGYCYLEITHGGHELIVGALVGKADAYIHEDNHFTGLWYVIDGQYPLVSSDWKDVRRVTMGIRGGDARSTRASIDELASLLLQSFRLRVLTSFAPICLSWRDPEQDTTINMSFMLHKVFPTIPEGDTPGYMELLGYDLTHNVWREMVLDDVYPPSRKE
jgi:hypothetical protein